MRITIGKKLFLGFAVILILMVIMGSVAYWSLGMVKRGSETMRAISYKSEKLFTLTSKIYDALIINDIVVGGNIKLYDHFRPTADLIDEEMQKIEKLDFNDEEQRIFKSIKANFSGLMNYTGELIKLNDLVRGSAAVELVGNIDSAAQGLINDADSFEKLLEEEKSKAIILADHAKTVATSAITAISLLAIILSLGIGFILARLITTKLRSLTIATEKIAKGDLTIKIDVKSEDEIGDLVSSFNKMTDALQKSRGELVVAKEFVENILNTMHDGLDLVNQDGTIQFANNVFLDTFGKDIIGRKCYEVYRMDKKQCNMCPLKDIGVGKTGTLEVSGVIGGKTFSVAYTGLENSDGSYAILEVFRDITELKKLEKMKDLLTHMIVHDLNNPLTAVLGRLQLLQMTSEGTLTDDQKEDIKQGLLAVNELKTMISNLLDINRMEEGKLTLRYENFNLRDLLQEIVNELMIMAEQEGKRLSLEIAESMPEAKADKELIRRIIANLINNAIKHTPREGRVSVKTFYKDGDKEFYVQVEDSGEGISKEYLVKIFEKFVQLEDKEAKRGHGLGLTFCKMAVEAHGGRIWVDSEVSKGSTFYFTIPVKE